MTSEDFTTLALSFVGTESYPHFGRVAFKVKGKRTFATLLEEGASVNIVLTVEEQREFCQSGKEQIFPVPNKWGEKGWTTFLLEHAVIDDITAALTLAYEAVIHKSITKNKNNEQ